MKIKKTFVILMILLLLFNLAFIEVGLANTKNTNEWNLSSDDLTSNELRANSSNSNFEKQKNNSWFLNLRIGIKDAFYKVIHPIKTTKNSISHIKTTITKGAEAISNLAKVQSSKRDKKNLKEMTSKTLVAITGHVSSLENFGMTALLNGEKVNKVNSTLDFTSNLNNDTALCLRPPCNNESMNFCELHPNDPICKKEILQCNGVKECDNIKEYCEQYPNKAECQEQPNYTYNPHGKEISLTKVIKENMKSGTTLNDPTSDTFSHVNSYQLDNFGEKQQKQAELEKKLKTIEVQLREIAERSDFYRYENRELKLTGQPKIFENPNRLSEEQNEFKEIQQDIEEIEREIKRIKKANNSFFD
ncbi:MAG: hypothetical protein ACOCQR_00220 [bacterium]